MRNDTHKKRQPLKMNTPESSETQSCAMLACIKTVHCVFTGFEYGHLAGCTSV